MKDTDDLVFINEILSGNRDSFKKLVKRYQVMVYHIALRLLGNREDAEEASQDSFLKIYQQLKNFRMESKFSSWLYRIVYNTCIDMTKGKHKQYQFQKIEELEYSLTHDKVFQSHIDFDLYFGKLPIQFREIILLFYYNNFSYKEISDLKNESIGNVKTLLFRARKRLKELILLEANGVNK